MTKQQALALAGKLLGLYPNIPSDIAIAGIWADKFCGEEFRAVVMAIDKCTSEEPRLNWPNFLPFLRSARDEVARFDAAKNPSPQIAAENEISEEQAEANRLTFVKRCRELAEKLSAGPSAPQKPRRKRQATPKEREQREAAEREIEAIRSRREAEGLDENFQPLQQQEAGDADQRTREGPEAGGVGEGQ